MAWTVRESYVVPQGIEDRSTTAKLPIGTTVRAEDPSYGHGVFVYVKGIANGALRAWATINEDDGVSALATANHRAPVGVMMAVLTASYYGFVQVKGKAIGACLTAFADNGRVYLTGTAGSVDDASVAGDVIYNATGASTTAVSSGVADFELNYPFCADRVSIIS